jgi:hypothetical protein
MGSPWDPIDGNAEAMARSRISLSSSLALSSVFSQGKVYQPSGNVSCCSPLSLSLSLNLDIIIYIVIAHPITPYRPRI